MSLISSKFIGLASQALYNTVGSFTGQAVGDTIDGNPINIRSAVAGSIGGTLGPGIAKRLFGPVACELALNVRFSSHTDDT